MEWSIHMLTMDSPDTVHVVYWYPPDFVGWSVHRTASGASLKAKRVKKHWYYYGINVKVEVRKEQSWERSY